MPTVTTLSYHHLPLSNGWYATVLSAQPELSQPCQVTAWPDDSHWQQFCNQLLKDPSVLSGFSPLKVSKNGQVCLAQVVGDGSGATQGVPLQVVCKQSLAGSKGRRILASLFGSRERRQFDVAKKLLNCGMATAIPYALVRKRFSPKGWLITGYLVNSIDLDQVVLRELPRMNGAMQRQVKDNVIQCLAGLLSKLRKHHIAHRDFKASNILVTDYASTDTQARVWLIDTEGIQVGIISTKQHVRSLVRLVASLTSYRGVTRTDLARLLISINKLVNESPNSWKTQLGMLLAQSQAYNDRARSRKSHKLDGYQ